MVFLCCLLVWFENVVVIVLVMICVLIVVCFVIFLWNFECVFLKVFKLEVVGILLDDLRRGCFFMVLFVML